MAALAWMRDALPWTASKPLGSASTAEATPADESLLPADLSVDQTRAFAAGGAHPTTQADPAIGQRAVSVSMPYDPGPDRRAAADPAGENSLRALINFGRDLAGHPLTWLVVLLVGIGHIVLSLAGRGK